MTEQQKCSDLPAVQLPPGDMLKNMMESQMSFQASLSTDFTNLVATHSAAGQGSSIQDWAQAMSYNILASHAELTELLEWIPWKNWKTYGPMTEAQLGEAKYEAIDILHFLFNMMMLLGMKPDDVYDLFMRKQMENRERQKRGY